MLRALAAAAALVALLGGAGCGSGVTAPPGGVVLDFGKHLMRAEVASTESERERGLMYRRALATDAGMIFVFPSGKSTGSFWMKDTLIPLSIAFLERRGAGYRVIAVMDMQPCRADPCPLYYPGRAYDAAVESSLGWYQARGVGMGTPVAVHGRLPTPS
jgi:uncharacterized membrane protein (UPF0127 family)